MSNRIGGKGSILKEAKRVSKKYIIISVPNFNSLPARIQILLGLIPENNRPQKGHIFWFNYSSLKRMIRGDGWKQIDLCVNAIWRDYFLVGTILRFLAYVWPSLFALSFIVKLERLPISQK